MDNSIYYVLISGILALAFSFWKKSWIESQSQGNERMKNIGKSISDGAMAFLKAEYRVLTLFVLAVAVILGYVNDGRSDSSAIISFSFAPGRIRYSQIKLQFLGIIFSAVPPDIGPTWTLV